MTQEIASLKDELRGIFDDRKMNVRMEQKKMDGEVSHSSSVLPMINH
jgi:hypothetical protein